MTVLVTFNLERTPVPDQIVRVTAPSRLHFGLLAFGDGVERQFGGVGVMVEHPGLMLEVHPDEPLAFLGLHTERIEKFVKAWSGYHQRRVTGGRFELLAAPRLHTGLGVGTQLGLAVARALDTVHAMNHASDPVRLAISVGRGARSAVGTYGFCFGGLVVEAGKSNGEAISPISRRIELPSEWRFLLVIPRRQAGLAGELENEAFRKLPAVPEPTTRELRDILDRRLVPAAESGDFETFSEAVFEYGYHAGLCFAEMQGGAYNGPHLAELVEAIRAKQVRGVGQSSWGPTVFALCPDEGSAVGLNKQLTRNRLVDDSEIWITPVANRGARVEVLR